MVKSTCCSATVIKCRSEFAFIFTPRAGMKKLYHQFFHFFRQCRSQERHPGRNTRRRFPRWDHRMFGSSRGTNIRSEKYCIGNIFHTSCGGWSSPFFRFIRPADSAVLLLTVTAAVIKGDVCENLFSHGCRCRSVTDSPERAGIHPAQDSDWIGVIPL